MIKNKVKFLLAILCLSLIAGYLVGSIVNILLFIIVISICVLFVMKAKRYK